VGTPASFTIDNGVLVVDFKEFNTRFARALKPLIAYLRSAGFRNHPRWRGLMPFDVPSYGNAPSLGHCVRPDVIPTADGPRVCELDFVPSGRGFVLECLASTAHQELFLSAFADWYRTMHRGGVTYATGTTTICWEESVRFAQLMRDLMGVPVDAINVDTDDVEQDSIVDRLFYRSELVNPDATLHSTVFTAEPWLDSKMVFAVVHDPTMTAELTAAVGAENLAFLREVLLETHALNELRADRPDFLTDNVLGIARSGRHETARRRGWVLKNSDVETAECWGSRGVMVGANYNESGFADAVLRGVNPQRKNLGRSPVLQRFAQCDDLGAIWNRVLDGQVYRPPAGTFGWGTSPTAHQPASRHVYGRIGFYFLISSETGEVFNPDFGICTLRQDVVAHGATDAQLIALRAALYGVLTTPDRTPSRCGPHYRSRRQYGGRDRLGRADHC
jgi:hypothetical protein